MSRSFLEAVFSGVLLTVLFSMSGYAQGSPTYDNLTVTQKAGIGGAIDAAHRLTVTSSYADIGSGMGPLYVKRNGASGVNCGGTSWGFLGADVAVRGYSYWGNPYSAGVGAFSDLDHKFSAALVAARTDGSVTAKLAYKDASHYVWPGFLTTTGANALQYGIAIRNPDGTDAGGTATGILFSCEAVSEFGKGAIVYERKRSYARGSIHFLQEANANAYNPGLANKVMTITNSGQVGIGIEPVSTANKLEVNGNAAFKGTVYCNALTVTATISPWPDYVFNKNYKVQPLSETESFIKKNGHLPGMPSQKDIAKNGINVGEMQAKLLKGMEEMTLQMIALKKENEELRGRLEKVERD